MSIEKSLYQAPVGLEELAASEPDIEIEIVDPESVTIGMDGLEIEIEPEEPSDEDFDANLAEYVPDDVLQTIASDLTGDFEDDVSARKDWMQT